MHKIYILGYGCIYDPAFAYSDQWIQKPKLDWEANLAGTLTFTIGKEMNGYAVLEILKGTVIATSRNPKSNSDEIIWAGRVLEESRDENNDRKIICEGALAFLNDSIQPFSKFDARTSSVVVSFKQHFETIINFHNGIASENRRFDISDMLSKKSYLDKIDDELFPKTGQDILYTSKMREAKTTLSLLTEQFLNQWGGYFKLSYAVTDRVTGKPCSFELSTAVLTTKLDYIDAYDPDSNRISDQPIQFGVNMLSLTRTASADDFATVLYPLGASLDDYQKSWILRKHIYTDHYRTYNESPTDFADNKYMFGQIIDGDTGWTVGTTDKKFALTPFIAVAPGDRYFLTTYMRGVPIKGANGQSKDSDGKTGYAATAYAIYKSDKSTAIEIGNTARNTIDNDTGTENVVDVYVDKTEITIPENGAYLVVGIYDPNNVHDSWKLDLRKFNPNYAEENVSIMSVLSSEVDAPLEKQFLHEQGTDIYPVNTKTNPGFESFYRSRILFHSDLVKEFGVIVKTVEFDEAPYENPLYLYRKTADALLRMTEKIGIEVRAVDLSYISDEYSPLALLDLVNVTSSPHTLDTQLPILKLSLPLDAPEDAEYTLANEVETRDGTPSYMTVYMSDMYKKGRG